MAKPQLPARADPELYGYLKFLRDRVSILEKAVGTEDSEDGDSGGSFGSGETYTDIAPTSLASGTGTVAWTSIDVSVYISPSCTHVDIWAHIEVGANGDQGSIDFGSDGAAVAKPGPKTAEAQDSVDTASSTMNTRVPVADGLIYYQVTGSLSGTDSAWEIQIVGEYAAF